MADAITTVAGKVRAGGDILHARPRTCSHEGRNACSCCDFDGYYAGKHRGQCPWAEPEDYEDEDVVREQLQDDFERQLDREAGWGI